MQRSARGAVKYILTVSPFGDDTGPLLAMNMKLFLVILRSWYVLILFTLAVTLVSASIITTLQPERFTATTSLVLNFNGGTPFEQAGVPAQLASSYIATQRDIIRSRKVALTVVELLRLDEDSARRAEYERSGSTGGIDNWLASWLLKNLQVEPMRDSRVMDISYQSTDPVQATDIANAFAQAYIATSLELSIAPARRNAAWFDEQLQVLRKRLEDAEARLTNFQQEKGIVALDERLDTETIRLNELSNALVAAQSETYNVQSRQLGENHPEYRRAIERERSARRILDQQKAHVLELKQQRDQLGSLAREVENEQQNYEATLQSYYQTRLESQVDQTNIAVLTPAVPPQEPDSPDVALNMVSAGFLGLLLGVGLAVVSEVFNRKIRTADDVSELLGVPVLTTV
jgi:polysaccharide biosynthesis transport protein